MLPKLSPHDFVAKWRKVELSERSAVQQHFLDLCALVGHDSPADADPTGHDFAFEMGATKTAGEHGWADLVKLRDAWLNPPGASEADLKKRTLTNLYNQRPTWLANAHRRLDEAVFAAYGWPASLSDDELLARLLALNLERAQGQGEEV